jgi:transcriptional regulator with XRE-family HTH domain
MSKHRIPCAVDRARREEFDYRRAEKFGAVLRELRRQCGVTQRQLAARAGVDFTYISKLENGAMLPPSSTTIEAFAKGLSSDRRPLIPLLLAAGKLPSNFDEALSEAPAVHKWLCHLANLSQERRARLNEKFAGLLKEVES